ncbi:MAG: hypothetical protein AAGM46_27540, partial [Cyanobacteria bacterium J06582_2]
ITFRLVKTICPLFSFFFARAAKANARLHELSQACLLLGSILQHSGWLQEFHKFRARTYLFQARRSGALNHRSDSINRFSFLRRLALDL